MNLVARLWILSSLEIIVQCLGAPRPGLCSQDERELARGIMCALRKYCE